MKQTRQDVEIVHLAEHTVAPVERFPNFTNSYVSAGFWAAKACQRVLRGFRSVGRAYPHHCPSRFFSSRCVADRLRRRGDPARDQPDDAPGLRQRGHVRDTARRPRYPGPTASATPDKPPPAKEPETAKFDSLPKDKKVEIMSTKVVPNLGKDFKEYDGKRFATFGCATCHGPKKNEDPHKVLPKITLSNGGWEKMQKNKPELAKFMSEKVVPDMAAALGEKPMDPTTHQGFGCGGCHEVK